MNIVFEKEKKSYGNECIIEECYLILELFDRYFALHVTNYSGWFGTDNNEDSKWCDTEHEAMKKLKDWGLED